MASRIKVSPALVFFLAGLVCFVVVLVFQRAIRPLVAFGGTLWGIAYFLVLADNWKRKSPQNFGMVKFEEKPFTYRFHFGCMAIIGLVFLLGMLGVLFHLDR